MPDRDKKVYSVDRALEERRPHIELKGEVYPLADHRTDEALRLRRKIYLTQKRIEERVGEQEDQEALEDESIDDLQGLIAKTVQIILEGVPDEVARDVTEAEFEILQNTVREINQEGYGTAKEINEEEGKG